MVSLFKGSRSLNYEIWVPVFASVSLPRCLTATRTFTVPRERLLPTFGSGSKLAHQDTVFEKYGLSSLRTEIAPQKSPGLEGHVHLEPRTLREVRVPSLRPQRGGHFGAMGAEARGFWAGSRGVLGGVSCL